MGPPPLDPLIQAALDEQYNPVPLTVSPGANDVAICSSHSLEFCSDCDLDFRQLNAMTKLIAASNEIAIPPPPNVLHPGRSQAITKMKEDGNVGDIYGSSRSKLDVACAFRLRINNETGRKLFISIICPPDSQHHETLGSPRLLSGTRWRLSYAIDQLHSLQRRITFLPL